MREFFIFLFGLMMLMPQARAQNSVLRSFCQEIQAYRQQGDADYKPGIDVEGNPVVSADLNASVNTIKYPIDIPVKIDVVELLDDGAPEALAQSGAMETQVVLLRLFEDGRIEYNGRDISGRVTYACRENPDAALQEGGQATPAPVTSDAKPEPPSHEQAE